MRKKPGSTLSARLMTAVLAPVVTAASTVAATPASAQLARPAITKHAQAAVRYAASRHITSSIAVIDTKTGRTYTAGSTTRLYSSASVSKVFVATQLLASGQMHGWKASTAYAMITRSDNGARNRLLPYVGYAKVYDKVVSRYHIKIGQRSKVNNWTGDTQLTSRGMARFYAAVKKDKKVWPWLSNAMHHAARYAAGGVPQYFGIPSANPVGGFAIKQGWFSDCYSFHGCYAEGNSTGFVDHYRYVVVMLQSGAPGTYGSNPVTSYIGRTVNHEAALLMPHGRL